MQHPFFRCPTQDDARARLTKREGGLESPSGDFFKYAPGTDVPIFASEQQGVNEYTQHDAAQMHDNALNWVFRTFKASEEDLRCRLISRIGLSQGQRILITGAGAGNDLPYIADALSGNGEIHVQDIATEMLLAGYERYAEDLRSDSLAVEFSICDATSLPFDDGFFDAAYHFGGINLFPEIAQGIAEMNRVVRAGGQIVIGDEGLAPWMRDTEIGRMLINNNALYACEAPLQDLPPTAQDVTLSWELSNCFYVITFRASDSMPDIDIDVPHLGTRGGTIRSRYAGKLEGVDPDLRDRLYAQAKAEGISRVQFIESILRHALGSEQT